MEAPITYDQGERIIALLQVIAGITAPEEERSPARPIHSGHKGGDFLRETKREFEERFPDADLDWKTLQQWITTLFKMSSRFTSKVGDCTEDDVLWLYEVLSASLQNGFAQELSEKGS